MNAIYTPERAREFVRIVREGMMFTPVARYCGKQDCVDKCGKFTGLPNPHAVWVRGADGNNLWEDDSWEDWYVMAAMLREQAFQCAGMHRRATGGVLNAVWLEAYIEINNELLLFSQALNAFGWLG